MDYILGWLDLIRALVWMAIADTWIARRQRRERANETLLTLAQRDEPSADDKMIEQAVFALRVALVVAVLILFGVGFLTGWLAHSLGGR